MQSGALYSMLGSASCGSAVQGARAGEAAAEYALNAQRSSLVDAGTITKLMFAPRERTKGFTPAWVTRVLQNTMTPYFVLYVKKEDRLKAALANVEFLRDHMVPLLIAQDTHALRLAHETRNMILNAEMKLRASLFRTESRGTHYREDYPARNDCQWLAWVKMKPGPDGTMTLSKQLVPDAWKPNPLLPYEQRYPNRFPGELEFLGRQSCA